MSKESKDLIRRYVEECICRNDMSLVDQLLAQNYVWHTPTLGDLDLEAYKQFQPSVLAAFPDGHWTIEDMISEGDRVAYRWTFAGTHLAEFMGIAATGKKIRLSGMNISRIAHRRIAEDWEIYDAMGMMQQLGQR